MAHQAGAYPGFRSMKRRLGVFLLPPGWDASPSQGYPPALNLYTWVERGTVRVKVSCPRTQHNVRGQGSNPESSALTMRPPCLPQELELLTDICDFTYVIYVILVETRVLLTCDRLFLFFSGRIVKSSIESDIGMRVTIYGALN